MTNFTTYQSPFTWRYGSEEMRRIFSEKYKYELWRKIWVALARAQYKAGLVSKKELDDLEKNKDSIDIERILEIEKETTHDVVAAIKEFAGRAKAGGGKIHLGATSMDVVDNADAIRMKEALDIVEEKVKKLLVLFSGKIERYASLVCIGYTHLQPAEPTTVGYRLSSYAQDLLTDYQFLQFVKTQLKGKGMKGAVGTAASYTSLLQNAHSGEPKRLQKPDSGQARLAEVSAKLARMTVQDLEKEVMAEIGIEATLIATQVYPRKYDYLVLSVLNSTASSLAKFAGDLRILQSPSIGEWSEPFSKKQVGSSAMPFKKNPINSEKICSLARYISALPSIALENATLSYLERTLDDSANKRIIIPEAFLATNEILITAEKIIAGLVINEKRIAFNLNQYAPFSATELIIIEAVKKGVDRQEMHEVLRTIAMLAWSDVQEGKENPIVNLLEQNKEIKKYLSGEKIKQLLSVSSHVGDAPKRALLLVKLIQKELKYSGVMNHTTTNNKK